MMSLNVNLELIRLLVASPCARENEHLKDDLRRLPFERRGGKSGVIGGRDSTREKKVMARGSVAR